MIPILTFIAGCMVGAGAPHLVSWLLFKFDPEGFRRAQAIANERVTEEIRQGKFDL